MQASLYSLPASSVGGDPMVVYALNQLAPESSDIYAPFFAALSQSEATPRLPKTTLVPSAEQSSPTAAMSEGVSAWLTVAQFCPPSVDLRRGPMYDTA